MENFHGSFGPTLGSEAATPGSVCRLVSEALQQLVEVSHPSDSPLADFWTRGETGGPTNSPRVSMLDLFFLLISPATRSLGSWPSNLLITQILLQRVWGCFRSSVRKLPEVPYSFVRPLGKLSILGSVFCLGGGKLTWSPNK